MGTNMSGRLKSALMESNETYCREYGVTPREIRDSAVIYRRTSSEHGNFHSRVYEAILGNSDWSARLDKSHTYFGGTDIKELDSSSSSDALLMNFFCYPEISRWTGPSELLGLTSWSDMKFGWDPGLPNEAAGHHTECDLKIGTHIFEAKLTESDFTSKAQDVVRGYPNVDALFDLDRLCEPDGTVSNYQLIRNIIAAHQHGKKFTVLLDARRPDLIRNVMDTLLAVKDIEMTRRCGFCTWQELAASVGKDLGRFLSVKYGL